MGDGRLSETVSLHVVFGAGQVGSHLAEYLLAGGKRVRVAKRTPSGIPEGAEPMLGDATDPSFCRRAVSGASVVYHCMNPPYSAQAWEELMPRHLHNLVAAAGGKGARLVVLENLYMLDPGSGEPLHERTPFDPRSRKGEIQARMARALCEAHERGDVRAVSGRASDFYGPRGSGTYFADLFWSAALRGLPSPFPPNPDTPHTYHYIPDVAKGLELLGTAPDDVTGRSWMLPCAPAEPTRALVARFSEALGRDIRLLGLPRPLVKATGLIVPFVREIEEMLHQWDAPFVVDDSRFRERFGVAARDPDEGARRTVAWALARYGKGLARYDKEQARYGKPQEPASPGQESASRGQDSASGERDRASTNTG